MELRFAHQGNEGKPFHVPQEQLLGPYRSRPERGRPLDEQIDAALDDPLGAAPLEEAARRADRILLLVDDATRKTPTSRILPHLADRLASADVQDDQVTILVAQGTHRPMTPNELEQKLGPTMDRWRVEQHDGQDPGLLEAGQTREGMPIVVNRLLVDHDLIIGIGSVGVHGIMGYSGGAKILTIGAGGPATEAWTHWQAATRYETKDLLGVLDNPLRRNIDEAARVVGLDAVLNVVTDSDGNVHRAAYGDPLEVHRALVPEVQRRHAVTLPQQADISVIDASPSDRDFWQSIKGLYAGDLVTRDGGTIILVAPNPEGVADNHPNVIDLAGRSYADIVDAVDEGTVDDVVGAAIAAYTARLRRRARVHLVSGGVAPDDARALGFEPADDVQEALDEAMSTHGAQCYVTVLERAGLLLPVVRDVNSEATRVPLHTARAPGGRADDTT